MTGPQIKESEVAWTLLGFARQHLTRPDRHRACAYLGGADFVSAVHVMLDGLVRARVEVSPNYLTLMQRWVIRYQGSAIGSELHRLLKALAAFSTSEGERRRGAPLAALSTHRRPTAAPRI